MTTTSMNPLQIFTTDSWQAPFSDEEQNNALTELEMGKILYFPQLAFSLANDERIFLSPQYADPTSKNISFHAPTKKLWGIQHAADEERLRLKSMLNRYTENATNLIKTAMPRYSSALIVGRTSFRPLQIDGRISSYRKDDKRLHVDAFPSAPNQGKRILRVFSNINPHDESRVWRIGEPFVDAVKHFLPKLREPVPGHATLLRFLKITKSRRSLYDHFMLQLHDQMKADEHYQKHAPQNEIHFPVNSSWIVQTDHVSHAAMRGQYVLEQTFYLPVSAMQNELYSPLRILEQRIGRRLA